MDCFWAQGYELASIRMLSARMGITGASLYNAFGDKRELYGRALAHYLERSVRDRIGRLGALPPLASLRAFFDEIVQRSIDDPDCRGCLLVNAALELGPQDQGLRDVIVREMDAIAVFFRRCVARGQADGSVTRARPPEDLAQLLLSVLLGLRVLARTGPRREALEGAVAGAIALLAVGKAGLPATQ